MNTRLLSAETQSGTVSFSRTSIDDRVLLHKWSWYHPWQVDWSYYASTLCLTAEEHLVCELLWAWVGIIVHHDYYHFFRGYVFLIFCFLFSKLENRHRMGIGCHKLREGWSFSSPLWDSRLRSDSKVFNPRIALNGYYLKFQGRSPRFKDSQKIELIREIQILSFWASKPEKSRNETNLWPEGGYQGNEHFF